MRVVVADTGPIHYLVLIGHIDVLPKLFKKIFLPSNFRHRQKILDDLLAQHKPAG